jgi:phosphate transport system substrate-binding protein
LRPSNGGVLWSRIDSREDHPKAIIYFPTLVEGTSVIYNLPALKRPLCLSGETLAGIYSGQITVWNDEHISATNPGIKLPGKTIRVLNRSDENGMSWLLTRYLSHASKAWAVARGTSASPSWPTGFAVQSEQEMIAKVISSPYALGFASFYTARGKATSIAAIQNRAGTCELPSLSSLTVASISILRHLEIDSDMDAVDSNESGAYPITGFSGLIIPIYENPDHRAREIAGLVRYILTDGQTVATESRYVALPYSLVQFELQALDVLDHP